VTIKLFDHAQLPEGAALSFALHDEPYFAVRKDGCVFAYKNKCPHLGIPLEWQPNEFLDAEGELIQCSTHAALFLIDSGECVSGPCTGEKLTPVAITCDDTGVYLT